jgi:para-aminobenzoate synthetase component I
LKPIEPPVNTSVNVPANGADLQLCERYFWRSLPLANRSGSEIFEKLFQPQTCLAGAASIATLLESPYPLPPDSLPATATAMARYSICAGAPRKVAGKDQLWTPALGHIMPFLQQMEQAICNLPACAEPQLDELPFVGGWLGWLGYDFASEIERLPWLKEETLPFPVAFWYEPAEFAVLDHPLQRLWLAAETPERLERMVLRLAEHKHEQNAIGSDRFRKNADISSIYIDKKLRRFEGVRFEVEQAEFERAVRQAKAHIRAGDVFQVNHSLRFEAQTQADSWSLYKTLHRINPSPFASYWHSPWGAVVSCSPERLVQMQSGIAQSRPIAGTRARGKTTAEDRAIAQALKNDAKERAEHIMLVDLERNDLGRVCEWGSVQVAELMTLERYSHVMHLVSNVVGQLSAEQSIAQLIAAMFPGGTITGCPKVRCMEIIETLEPVRRSLFYGSCGYLDRRGRIDLNILIRTLLTVPTGTGQTVWGQVGAGIVADSKPSREWHESLQKAKAQLLALALAMESDLPGDTDSDGRKQ